MRGCPPSQQNMQQALCCCLQLLLARQLANLKQAVQRGTGQEDDDSWRVAGVHCVLDPHVPLLWQEALQGGAVRAWTNEAREGSEGGRKP